MGNFSLAQRDCPILYLLRCMYSPRTTQVRGPYSVLGSPVFNTGNTPKVRSHFRVSGPAKVFLPPSAELLLLRVELRTQDPPSGAKRQLPFLKNPLYPPTGPPQPPERGDVPGSPLRNPPTSIEVRHPTTSPLFQTKCTSP